MKKIIGILVAAISLMISGCAVTSPFLASIEQDAKAKEFVPAQGNASLYIYRNESYGGPVAMPVVVNGKILGVLTGHTFLRRDVLPGKYVVVSLAENDANLALTVEAGRNYFLWQEIKTGRDRARSLLHHVDENVGRTGVMESKLIAPSNSDSTWAPLDTHAATSPEPQTSTSSSVVQKLRELQSLKSEGLITEDEFQKKKVQLLEKL